MKRFFTHDEIEHIRQHFADTPTADIAKALDRPYHSIVNKAAAMGLKKSGAYLRSDKCGRLYSGCGIGRAHRFPKGQPAWNKGKKLGKEWTTGRMADTQFKAGNLPHNTKPEGDGAITKRSGGYWWIRISLGKWRQLHTNIWEQANRQIDPKTEMVKFRDGDRDNCALENLYLETRAGNMADNTIHRYPEEIKQAIAMKRTLTFTITHYAEKKNR